MGELSLYKGVSKGADHREGGDFTSLLPSVTYVSALDYCFLMYLTLESSQHSCRRHPGSEQETEYQGCKFTLTSLFWAPKYQPRFKKASEVEIRESMFTQASTVKNKSGHPDLWAPGLTHLHGNPGSPLNAKPLMG